MAQMCLNEALGCMRRSSAFESIRSLVPRPSSYPLLGPKYLLLGTIYPQLRVQGGSWYMGLLKWDCRFEFWEYSVRG